MINFLKIGMGKEKSILKLERNLIYLSQFLCVTDEVTDPEWAKILQLLFPFKLPETRGLVSLFPSLSQGLVQFRVQVTQFSRKYANPQHSIASCMDSAFILIHGNPQGVVTRVICPWGFGLQRSFQASTLSREVFIIPSARTSSAVSLQLPSLRIFNLLTRCICWVNTWRFPPMTSFQEISSFSKSGREGSKATRSEHEKRQIYMWNLWLVVNRIHLLLVAL